MKNLLILNLILLFVGTAFAHEAIQPGPWVNMSTWKEGSIPTSSDDVYINIEGTVTVGAGDVAAAKIVYLGTIDVSSVQGSTLSITGGSLDISEFHSYGGTALNVSGGTLNVAGEFRVSEVNNTLDAGTMTVTNGNITCGRKLTIGHLNEAVPGGILNMEGGTIHITGIGPGKPGLALAIAAGNGVLNMTGGTIILDYAFYHGKNGIATPETYGISHLEGGTIYANDVYAGETGVEPNDWMDIAGGTLILDGNKVELIQGYVTGSDYRGNTEKGYPWVSGYGNFILSDGMSSGVLAEYNPIADETTVTAVGLPGLVQPPKKPNPSGYYYVPVDSNLSWTQSWAMDANLDYIYADSYDVFLGTNYNDINSAEVGSVPAGVEHGTTEVNEYDPYGPGVLTSGTTYFWRVDANFIGDPNSPYRSEIWQFNTAPVKAYNPVPGDGASGVGVPLALSWSIGNDNGVDANSHELYIGPDYSDVNNATKASVPPGVNHQALSTNSYSPACALDKTYYWRVDEVYNGGTPIKGDVWSFTVSDNLILEDFEGYSSDSELQSVWQAEGGGNPYYESGIAIGGSSMEIIAFNFSYTFGGAYIVPYSDWSSTGLNAKSLWLWFYGQTGNLLQPIYVYFEDGSGGSHYVNYPDANDMQKEEWQVWRIDLADVSSEGVDMSDIVKFSVGIGDQATSGYFADIYFDDIKAYSPVCVPEVQKPNADWTDDCAVNMSDLSRLKNDWSKYSYTVSAEPVSPSELILQASFENNLNDLSGNSHNGTAIVRWIESPDDPNFDIPLLPSDIGKSPQYEAGPVGQALRLRFAPNPSKIEPNDMYYVDFGGGRAQTPAVKDYTTWPKPHGDSNNLKWPDTSKTSAWPSPWNPSNPDTWPNPKWPQMYEINPTDSNGWPDYDPSDPNTTPGAENYYAGSGIYNDANWPDGWDISDTSTWTAAFEWDANDFLTWADFNDGLTVACFVKLRDAELNIFNNKFVTRDFMPRGWSFVRTGAGYPRLEVALMSTGSGTTDITTANMLDAGTWYHVAGTYNGIVARLYLNGMLVDTLFDSGGFSYINTKEQRFNLKIGTRLDKADYAGHIDELYVFNRALSHGEIITLANEGGLGPGTGPIFVDVPIPEMDLVDDGVVNFKDYAGLMQQWLVNPEDFYWP